jgi:hypothetical protein
VRKGNRKFGAGSEVAARGENLGRALESLRRPSHPTEVRNEDIEVGEVRASALAVGQRNGASPALPAPGLDRRVRRKDLRHLVESLPLAFRTSRAEQREERGDGRGIEERKAPEESGQEARERVRQAPERHPSRPREMGVYRLLPRSREP